MKTKLEMRYRLEVHNAITKSIKRVQRGHNTVLDSGLTNLANGQGTSSLFLNLCVGADATSNDTPGGLLTFSQALTTITASAPFFTAAMIGGIFKYGHGTGGQELYITGVGVDGPPSLTCTVATSQTVAPSAGTVWAVNRTKLVAFQYNYDAYVTGATNCKTTQVYAGGVCTITHLRTFIINQKVAPYTINELGWGNGGGANPNINGRVALTVPEVIGVNDYLVIAVSLIYTLAPPIPVNSAAGDQLWTQYKGTGIFAGSFALEKWATETILASGASDNNHAVLDGGLNVGYLRLITDAAFVQNANIGAAGLVPATSYVSVSAQLSWAQVVGQYPGVSQCANSDTFNTAGEILYGIGVTKYPTGGEQIVYDMIPGWSGGVPATLPVGSFPVTTVWQNIWTRPLLNP